MKIPSTNYEITWHRPGEIANHSPEKVEKPSTSLSDVLPIKVRPTDERRTAYRIRSQFISQARKLTAFISANPKIAANPKWDPAFAQTPEERALSAQKNKSAAEEALKDVRLALYNKNYGSLKSDNKFNLDKRDSEGSRINKGKFYNFSDIGNITNRFHQSAMRSQAIWESTKINCDGLALAAMDYVSHKHPEISVARLLLPGHSLMTLGEITPDLANLPLAAWPEHIHVCDPWTNITCSAPDYPKKFLEKMEKWNTGNKLIRDKHEWINPNNEKWRSCVKENPKILVRLRYEKGLFHDDLLLPPPVELES
ncbi:hypothetical protein ACFQDN_21395 [Pseudomonas asuensis]|uniref:Uncharacterized protein n=1 Tax=Pseudomonas asuensis TaxID=1825787 RepID=A0ABQ2H4N2_9PSED|nr:hypothetical protein [Pseudomonas asuensis]GGM31844.1 hypothetical protein GCM10009425_48030 [Pseudomonas asuensis]